MYVLLVLILYFIVVLGVLIFYLSLLFSNWSEAPFVPTGKRDLKEILDAAQIQSGEVVYDLGSGDGRVVRAAARRGAHAVGYEKSYVLVFLSRLITYFSDTRSRAIFKRTNYLNESFSSADVIFCYLMPKAMENLQEKFEIELKPGARIISRAFKVPGWIPVRRLKFTRRSPPVYIYTRA